MSLSAETIMKKGELIRRLLKDVEDYYEAFSEPMPFKALSQKYNKAMARVGGFHRTLEELENDGSVSVELHRTGARSIWPGSISAKARKRA